MSTSEKLDPIADAVDHAIANNTLAMQLARESLSMPIFACIELEKMLKENATARGIVRAMLEKSAV